LLILDEPTNHLDFDTVCALQEALKVFKGGVVVISHNQSFIEEVAEDVYLIQSRKVKRLEGGLGGYISQLKGKIRTSFS
jgi:ATPase subunit of ABC transporter with duplicated ATPase domains